MGLLDFIIEIVADMTASMGIGRRGGSSRRRERREGGGGLRRLAHRIRRRA